MQICERHKTILKGALAEKGFNPRIHLDAFHQACSLILQNAFNNTPKLLESPPHICPLCELPIATQVKWIEECAKSIKHERKLQ